MFNPRFYLKMALTMVFLLCVTSTASATIYTYDDLNRLKSISYDSGKKVIYTYDANGNLLTMTTSNMLPAKGYIDTPTEGQTVSGTVSISGWFLDGSGVAKIEVMVDGVLKGQAVYGDARPDVENAYPAYNNSNSGYHFNLDTKTLSNGNHTITISETDINGVQTRLTERTVVVSNIILPSRGSIDTLTQGQTISGTVNVGGWFLDGSGVAKIEVLVDGVLKGYAVYGGARPDVTSVYPEYNNNNSGYNYSLDTGTLTNGSHTLIVRETGNNGAQYSLSITVTVSNLPARGSIDTLTQGQTISGTVNVGGWFLDGSGVSKIEVLVDGVLKGYAVYGGARPDVTSVYPEYYNNNSGYNYSLDTRILTEGSHMLTVREIAKNGTQYSLSVTLTVSNLPARGSIDTLTQGQTISGMVNVGGWFLDGSGVSKIEVLADGVLKGYAVYGGARPDVTSVYPEYYNNNSGYNYSLDTGTLTNGSHTLTVRETGSNGAQYSLSVTVTVSNHPTRGSIDTPIQGQTISGTVNVGGWFLDSYGVSKIEVLVDGVLKGHAVYGSMRPDVASVYPEYNNSNSGYNYSLDTGTLTNGSHTLTVRETGNNGTQYILSITVTVSNLPAKGYIDTPTEGQTINGIFTVSGWFLDGSGVSKIEVLVDGVLKGYAVYGDTRPDVTSVFPEYNNNNSGYRYSLDTRTLTNDSHTITIRETANNGTQTTLPTRTVTVSN